MEREGRRHTGIGKWWYEGGGREVYKGNKERENKK